MAEPIPAQMFPTVPTGDDDHVINHADLFEFAQDRQAGTAFAVICFQRCAL